MGNLGVFKFDNFINERTSSSHYIRPFFQKVATAFITTCNNTSSILDSEKSRKSFCLIMESDKL